jgi:hypothetical protein
MFTSFIAICKSLPADFWYVLGGFLGVSSVTTPIAIAFLISNSGTINYKAGDTEIMLHGKELSTINADNMAKLEAQLEAQNQTILELTDAARKKNLEQKLKPELKQLQEDVQESQIRLEDAQESQEDLSNFVEEQSMSNE